MRAGEVEFLQQMWNQFRPIEGILQAARKTGEAALGLVNALDPGGWQQPGGATLAEKGLERPLRPFEAEVAQSAHVGLERRGLLGIGGDVAGGKQPVEFLLIQRAVEPAQRILRRARQSNLAERDSQRELEGRAPSQT